MPRNNSPERRAERKHSARVRQGESRWGNEQVDVLDERLGKGVGAVRERAALNPQQKKN